MTQTRFQSKASGHSDRAVPSVHVVTFGCQMNKYDSLLVEGRFRRRGWRTTAELDDADVVLFNTCSVRDHAEERVYSWLGELKQLKRQRPDVVLGVMGCMAQRVGDDVFARAGHVDIVCGTRQFQHLPQMVEEVRARRAEPERFAPHERRLLNLEMSDAVDVERAGEPYAGGRHGYLAVMRGCDLSCAFCVVPATRGRVLSRPIDDLVREAEWMVSQGAQVITLLGQTVNSYGEDLPKPGPGERRWRGRQGRPGLADLLWRLQEVDGLERLRLVTLHPAYVTEALAEAIAGCSKVDRFLPLPLQAGSDRVLKAMKRGYTTELYARRVELLRAHVPDIELASDWIVGFPTETDQEFAASERWLEHYGFVVNYVFKYSPRPNTAAWQKLDDDVPEGVKKERNQRLLRAAERAGLARHRAQIGRVQPVFVESVSERYPGSVQGRTHANLAISLPGSEELVGRTVRVEPREASPYGLSGVIAGDCTVSHTPPPQGGVAG